MLPKFMQMLPLLFRLEPLTRPTTRTPSRAEVWISSYESEKASATAFLPDEWCNEATLGLVHEDSQQLVTAAIGIAIFDEKARNRRLATAADLAFIWAMLHALGLKDAPVLSLRDSESSMRLCDPAGVMPAAFVNMVETVRSRELLMEQRQQHSEHAEWEHALQAFNKALNLCESVPDLKCGPVQAAEKTLAEIEPDSPERMKDWIADFTTTGITALEHVGDEAFGSLKHDDATTHVSTVLSLSPLSPARLLINCRSARAAKGLCDDTLQDANEVVKAGSFLWGYEAMCVALHGAKQYHEAIDSFTSTLEVIEWSHGPCNKAFLPPA
ncbi:hypothetical protein EDC04DRAFT_3138105 [Pisolithus marmoratus]|nr:hypothetical protein EDC04DRAFT_3138105 [Pisolithus marmoratus]